MTDLFDHRITQAIAKIDARLADLPPENVQRLDTNARLDFDEWFACGEIPSRALMAGVLTADEAQKLHAIHTGHSVDAYNAQPIAERVVFLQTIGELKKAGI